MSAPDPDTHADDASDPNEPHRTNSDQRSDDMAGADVTNGEGAFDPAEADGRADRDDVGAGDDDRA